MAECQEEGDIEMVMMKRYHILILSIILLCPLLSGCGGEKCDICGKTGADYKLFEYKLCRECYLSVMDNSDEDKVIDEIEIVEQNLKIRSSRNYFDYEVTVKNNSKETLSYIEVNIYLKDSDGNIIHSDWTNWSGTLPPGASTTLDTIIDYVENVTYYSVSVTKVSVD